LLSLIQFQQVILMHRNYLIYDGVMLMNLLDGKVCVITGSGRGIGKTTAKQFAKEGAKVVVAEFEETSGKSTADEVGGLFVKTDVADKKSVDSLIQSTMDAYGCVDVLVNNAGITRDNLLMRMKDDEWQDIIDTNLTSIFTLSKAVLRGMMKKRFGRIVNIGSVVGSAGNAGQANYAAAKAGVIGFSKSMAREVASRGITINVVAPGFIDTDMTKALTDDQKEAIFKDIPANRLGEPDEIAATVAFLVSDGAAYITGETIHVNGGMYMG
jgi:3-oxoacyl-[acyl-carrier protein] reductase